MRHQDWQHRLFQAVEDARGLPHVWGSNDCGIFTLCKWYEAVTGLESPIACLVGTYHDEAGAMAIMVGLGVDDVEAFAALYLPRYDAPQLAMRGDIGVVLRRDQKILVGVAGQACFAPGEDSLSSVSRSHLIASFKVG